MPMHKLKAEWTQIGSPGEMVSVINSGKVPVLITGGSVLPPGAIHNSLGLREPLFARSEEAGAEVITNASRLDADTMRQMGIRV